MKVAYARKGVFVITGVGSSNMLKKLMPIAGTMLASQSKQE